MCADETLDRVAGMFYRYEYSHADEFGPLDWYLALAALVPRSSEPLMDEDELRARIEGMAQ